MCLCVDNIELTVQWYPKNYNMMQTLYTYNSEIAIDDYPLFALFRFLQESYLHV